MDKVLLIDGANQIWRATVSFGEKKHYECKTDCPEKHRKGQAHCFCGALWDAQDKKCYGQKYGFVYSFFKNLRPLIELFSPDKCFMVMEGHPQFRYDLFPNYKANRIIKRAAKKETMEKFLDAQNQILLILKCLPITIVRASDFEADDTIGTLVDNLKDENVTVISNDSDYIQLLQRGYKNLTIYNPIKKENMVAPNYHYIAWKSLAGDKADNISPLLKPKKALDTVSDPKLFEKFMLIEENRANFSMNRQLIEFKPVPEKDIIFIEGERHYFKLKAHFHIMDFQSIINDASWDKYTKTFDCLKY